MHDGVDELARREAVHRVGRVVEHEQPKHRAVERDLHEVEAARLGQPRRRVALARVREAVDGHAERYQRVMLRIRQRLAEHHGPVRVAEPRQVAEHAHQVRAVEVACM